MYWNERGLTNGAGGSESGGWDGWRTLAAYEEVIARYGDATDPDLVVLVAAALVSKGVTLGELGRPEEALAAYEEVIARYGDATDPELVDLVALAKDLRDFLVEP